MRFQVGPPFVPKRDNIITDKDWPPPKGTLVLPVERLPEVGTTITDPEALDLIQIARRRNVREMILMDPRGEEMVFRF